MKKISVIILIIACMGFISCSPDTPASNNKLLIVTSIYPIFDITRNITGDIAEVYNIIPAGANPHTYEPSPSAVSKIRHADIFIGINKNFDGWIGKFIPHKSAILYTMDTATDDHKTEGRHDNPHVWLSVRRSIKIAESISYLVSSEDKTGATLYEKNLRSYINKLKDLDKRISAYFSGIPDKKCIQWHNALDYFAEDYGLTIVGTIERGHGVKPSVRSFKNLIERAKDKNTKIIVMGLNVNNSEIEVFSREIGGRIVRLDIIGSESASERSTYIKMMDFNARTLSEAMKRNM